MNSWVAPDTEITEISILQNEEIIGKIGSLQISKQDKDYTVFLSERFAVQGDDTNIAKLFSNHSCFSVSIKSYKVVGSNKIPTSGPVRLNNCVIQDHSFCYSNNKISIADQVVFKSYNSEASLNNEDYEKWLESIFVW